MTGLLNMTPVAIGDVRFDDAGFWGKRRRVNREVTLPSQYQHLEKTGRLDGLDPSHSEHHKFWDSDLAKWMEAVAYSLMTHADAGLEGKLEGVIERFGRLQCDDGYINSWFTSTSPEKRWTNLRDDHELYCAGHLIEAAVAHFEATGKRHFMDMMTRYADYIDSVFGCEQGKKRGYPGHEEIELALVKLAAASGESRHVDLARFFIDERGRQPHYFELEAEARGETGEPREYAIYQAHAPVREQTYAAGHAVRAMYLYCAMADMARLDEDEQLLRALDALWRNVCLKQMYVTGSVGASGAGERFTTDYDLPEETSYCETCAAIGLVLWNHRLLNMFGEARFADVLERALYNGVLSGISLSGDRYFYVNPLASTGEHERQEWFGCACCPPNISRLIAGLGRFAYSQGDAAWVHLFAAGSAKLQVSGGTVELIQTTDYPWDGAVRLEVRPQAEGREFALHVRIPTWCRSATLAINGQAVDVDSLTSAGYARLVREWRSGDVVELELPMPTERVRANPQVRMANGKTALQRGPLVYCLEEADNAITPLSRVAIPATTEFECAWRSELLGGVTVLEGDAEVASSRGWDDALYGSAPVVSESRPVTAVPYYAWNERGAGQMLVWIRELGGGTDRD